MKYDGSLNVLIVHPQFISPGGAELVSLRIIELLIVKYQARITILCSEKFDLKELQDQTSIYFPKNDVKVIVSGQPKWLRLLYPSLHQLRLAYLHKHAKSIAKNYNLCIGTYNEIDFGKIGIQYIHHPSFADSKFLEKFDMTGGSKIKNVRIIEKVYMQIVQFVSRDSIDGFKRNLSLANSEFIAKKIEDLYGFSPTVVYPSVTSVGDKKIEIPWNDRKLRFVTVGRIAADKNLTDYVDICRSIKTLFSDAKFMIIGRAGEKKYLNFLKKYIEQSKIAVEICSNLSKKEIMDILQDSKFYIAVKKYEHYGIATLEAAETGCLTFVHNSGGQVEVIRSASLRYETAEDLVNKIQYFLNNNEARDVTLKDLKSGIKQFTLQRFNAEISDAMESLVV